MVGDASFMDCGFGVWYRAYAEFCIGGVRRWWVGGVAVGGRVVREGGGVVAEGRVVGGGGGVGRGGGGVGVVRGGGGRLGAGGGG